MKIEEGKTYRTRDGDTVGPMTRWPELPEYFHFEGDGGGRLWNLDGSRLTEERCDLTLIEEPKKEISDMSEVKFKVGDRVKSVSGEGYDKNWDNVIIHQIDEDGNALCIWGRQNGVGDVGLFNKYMIELIPSTPKPNTKWVFNDVQDFVVRVVGFNDKGQIVLEALNNEKDSLGFDFGHEKGSYFTFENEPEKFGEFYKPWVEKVEKQKIVGFNAVVRWKEENSISFFGCFDTEEEARQEVQNQWNGEDLELLDVVKVEWSE